MSVKRMGCFLLALLMAFGAVSTASADDAPYTINITGETFAAGGTFNNWTIYGASVVGCAVTETEIPQTKIPQTEPEQKHYNRIYDIKLASGTPMNAALDVACSITQKSSFPIVTNITGANAAPLLTSWSKIKGNNYKSPVVLENGRGSLNLYIYDNLSLTPQVCLTNTFNFSIAEADTSHDPDPGEVASIAITQPPAKTTYFVGERFDPAGMVVTAALLDEESEPVPIAGYTYEPSGALATQGAGTVMVSFGGYTAAQEIEVLPSAAIGDVGITNGQFLPDLRLAYGVVTRLANTYNAVALYGETKANITFRVGEGSEVYIGDEKQTVAEDGQCSLPMDVSEDGSTTVVRVQAGGNHRDYTFTCYTQILDGMPSAVTDYLCLASQYTNGATLGAYGLNPTSTLRGKYPTNTTGDMMTGPVSLGNFGGYITYYYEDAIVDNPNNPYGVDFIIYGNSVDGSSAFAEPGNVMVSADGETWYTLAGSLHYDDCSIWDYTMVYTKDSAGKSSWTDNRGRSGTGDKYPSKEYYRLHRWTPEELSQITVTGVSLEPNSMRNEYGNTEPPYPDFGYADSGMRGSGNQAFNPYTGTVVIGSRTYTDNDRTDGFDLKWAVDADGYPATLPEGGIHYIKIQTASNINSGGGGIGEKSTEINMVRVAAPAETDVGLSAAPAEIKVDGQAVSLTDGVYKYDASTSGIFEVSVTADGDANVYVNGARAPSANFEKIPDHGILRVLVQEGEKAPRIYYLTLTDRGGAKPYTAITFDANGGRVENRLSVTRYYDADTQDTSFPVPMREGYTFLGWASGQKNYGRYASDIPAGALTLKAGWKSNDAQENPAASQIKVTFRLIGATLATRDVDIGRNINDSKYVTWIATRSYTMDKGDTVYDLFLSAIDRAGLNARGQDTNYVTTITAPKALGGYKLSEFTNGQYSGWMYTVNGAHPGYGLREQALEDGGRVVFHYVNDYRYEIADWFDDPDFPALGDGSDWNKWLLAEDKDPDGSKISDGMPAPSPASTALTPGATASDGTAAVSLSASDMAGAIRDARENGNKSIVIAPEITGTVKRVTVEVPKDSLSALAGQSDVDLIIRTPVGSVTLPNGAVASIASQASGNTVTVSLEAVDASSLTPAQKEAVGNNPVYDISIMSGGQNISSFSGGGITISLPYTLKDGEDPSGVTVWYLNDAGGLVKMACTYDQAAGMASFTTPHLSYYVVGYTETWQNPFTDVKPTDWFYGAVEFAAEKGLFNGTTTITFSPNTAMTKAMLVTILYRLDGSPVVTGNNGFSDVKEDEWYTDAVIWAYANNIAEGYDGRFGTGDNVTREQVAAILYRYAQYKGCDITKAADLSAFTDGSGIGSWAQAGMKWANAEGLITGRTATTLVPGGNATRAELAAILMRFIRNSAK